MSIRFLIGWMFCVISMQGLIWSSGTIANCFAQDEESLSDRIASRLIGRYELQGTDPRVKMPKVLVFGKDGALHYSTGPGAAKPGMTEGSFDVLDDGSLSLNCEEYFVDGGNSNFRIKGDAKDLTPDKRYKKFTLGGKFEYGRVDAANSKIALEKPAALHNEVELKPGVLTAIALRGEAAPGCKDGAKYTAFGSPVINEQGEIAFRAQLDKDVVEGRSSNEGIFGGKAGAVRLWMRTGTDLPDELPRGLKPEPRQSIDAPKTVKNRYVQWLGKRDDSVTPPTDWREMLALSSEGTALFTAVVHHADGSQRRAIFSASATPSAFENSWHVVAIEGDAVPATRGGKVVLDVMRFVNLIEGDIRESEAWFLSGNKPQLVRAMWAEYGVRPELKLTGLAPGESISEVLDFVVKAQHAAVKARIIGAGVTEANDEAIWLLKGNTMGLVLREGEAAPDFTGKALTVDSPTILGPSTEGVLIRVKLRDGATAEDGAIILCKPGIKAVTRVWGKHSTLNRNVKVASIEWSGNDAAGPMDVSVVIAQTLSNGAEIGGLHVVDAGIGNLADLSQPLSERMKREKFPSFRNPLGLANRAVIPAQERGLLTMQAKSGPRWTQCPIKVGDPAPGMTGYTFAGFTKPLINHVLIASVRSSSSGGPGTRQALWVVGSKMLGSWPTQLVVHEGQTIEVKPGDRRIVAQITPAQEPAHRTISQWINLEHVIVVRLAFTDGSEGIFGMKAPRKELATKGSGTLKDEAK